MSANTEHFHLTAWNMNGGPIPADTAKALSEAVEAILKAAEDKNGTRLLYSINLSEAEVAA
jgi:hypothetical protein